jgi:UDP-N-acetylglucosamine 4,6-dehydratase
MVPEDDAHHTLEFDDYYAIMPTLDGLERPQGEMRKAGRPCKDGFRYGSDTNTWWLSVEELREMIQHTPAESYA